ncbi:MAG: alpha/beta hydrolase [Acidobacteriia bacterium]|nr:alpha/beta hydrolase [Terriglobia bacterium]
MVNIDQLEQPGVRGWLHNPDKVTAAMLLSHGAGGDCNAPLMVAVAKAFSEAGYLVLRWDLPFRQAGPRSAPGGSGKRDRDGILLAAKLLRQLEPDVPLYLAGQSYGGRQSSMVAAEDPGAADGLLLLSYPLHPPGKPAQLRTDHFPALRTPALFVHGTSDPFGTVDELREAIKLIPVAPRLQVVGGAGHGVPPATAASMPGWLSA